MEDRTVLLSLRTPSDITPVLVLVCAKSPAFPRLVVPVPGVTEEEMVVTLGTVTTLPKAVVALIVTVAVPLEKEVATTLNFLAPAAPTIDKLVFAAVEENNEGDATVVG